MVGFPSRPGGSPSRERARPTRRVAKRRLTRPLRKLRAQQLAKRKAKAPYESARLTKIAVIAVIEYKEGIFAQDLATVDGEIKLTSPDLQRSKDRLEGQAVCSRRASSRRPRKPGRANLREHQFALEQSESKRKVLLEDTRGPVDKEFKSEVEKASADDWPGRKRGNGRSSTRPNWNDGSSRARTERTQVRSTRDDHDPSPPLGSGVISMSSHPIAPRQDIPALILVGAFISVSGACSPSRLRSPGRPRRDFGLAGDHAAPASRLPLTRSRNFGRSNWPHERPKPPTRSPGRHAN